MYKIPESRRKQQWARTRKMGIRRVKCLLVRRDAASRKVWTVVLVDEYGDPI